MKGIPESRKSPHVWIVLLKDLGDYALYLNKTDNCFSGFEVHKIRIRDAVECDIKTKDGVVRHISAPKRRVIASNEDFGKFAWHYPNINFVYNEHPQFEKHKHEIETRLKDATDTIPKRILRDTYGKTTTAGSKPLGSKPLPYVITKNGTMPTITQRSV